MRVTVKNKTLLKNFHDVPPGSVIRLSREGATYLRLKYGFICLDSDSTWSPFEKFVGVYDFTDLGPLQIEHA